MNSWFYSIPDKLHLPSPTTAFLTSFAMAQNYLFEVYNFPYPQFESPRRELLLFLSLSLSLSRILGCVAPLVGTGLRMGINSGL